MEDKIIIRLKSNIVLKSMYDKRPKDYVPIELLGQVDKSYFDVRNERWNTPEQNDRIEKLLWYAERIVDVYEPKQVFNQSIEIINNEESIDDNEKSIEKETSFEVYDVVDELDTNPIINTILNKYPFEKNLFCKYISNICSELDNAINHISKNDYDDLVFSLDRIRESYRKLMLVIFELKLGFNVKSLGDYYKAMNMFKLETFFKENNMSNNDISKLKKFHDLINAFGHRNDNGDRRVLNANTIDDFKNSSINERKAILLSVPNFLININLTNAEMKTLSNKLSVQ